MLIRPSGVNVLALLQLALARARQLDTQVTGSTSGRLLALEQLLAEPYHLHQQQQLAPAV